MSLDTNSVTPSSSGNPTSVSVSIRRRMRILREVSKCRHDQAEPIIMTPEVTRSLNQQYSQTSSRFDEMDDEDVAREGAQAQAWLFDLLDYHERSFNHEMDMRMFKGAIERQEGERTERELLYMALTDGELPPREKLKAGLAIVLHYNFATRLKEVSKRAKELADQMKRVESKDKELDQTRKLIAGKTDHLLIDDFACAVFLDEIKNASPPVIDDNAGCCPICQISYTDLSANSIDDLLSDYPVRIKFCGHIFGKSCLEQWMLTPKIDVARHPFRGCPTCRMQIEGTGVLGPAVLKAPSAPPQLLVHLKSNARAMITVGGLMDIGMDLQECVNLVQQAMSEEISAEQLLAELSGKGYEAEEKILKEKLEELQKEKWAWGFRGDGLWMALRDEWMACGKKATHV